MFTGIVEDIGRVIYIRNDKICIKSVIRDIKPGNSLMVDGVCLTVTTVDNSDKFIMDIGQETLKTTGLKRLRTGSCVNLERAMSLSDRIDGHLVYGHVMALGRIVSNKIKKNTNLITIRTRRDFVNKLVLKGSVAVNGVSLTVNEIKGDIFKVGLVPETVKRTNLGKLNSSHPVNLEADMIILSGRR